MAQRFVITSFEDEGFHNATWIFSLGRMKAQEGLRWHRHTRFMYRPAIINGRNLMYASTYNQVRQVDKVSSVAQDACWSSPSLTGRLNLSRQHEHSLTRVILRYESAADSEISLWGTGDGGVTWPDAFKTTVEITRTLGRIKRGIQTMYVTGTDLRFCIRLPTDSLVRVRGWSAEIIQRGNLGNLDQ